ncbi:glucosidase 2 subunit beta [Scaptodrosophila lebanonensis]|uniref:Glucosidase 2 subunit beta n=1 Tax=Drosophila lebanonensis TaxID=7225 RepID=A0A6J2SYX3_DROLE|nr:glucosidase 2 subunit beta [Scaptodrosophila lebanonensis]XP_030369776.1 glucosidase 2 subunit beta [Scaptodrosophila lebanonensis]
MRKTWVKRENIYYKPFYKQKSKMILLLIILVGISFIIYQASSINELPNVNAKWNLQHLKQKHKQMMQALGSKQDYDFGDAEAAIADSTGAAAEQPIKIIRGTRLFDYDAYKPNFDGKFSCLDGSKEIPFDQMNDNYCDCLTDGSDEPSTNACANGRFYCKYQKRHITGRGLDIYVPSSRVNDKVCDCCDGSDEWTTPGIQCPNKCA